MTLKYEVCVLSCPDFVCSDFIGTRCHAIATYAQYTPPTRLNSTVVSRRRRRCVLGYKGQTDTTTDRQIQWRQSKKTINIFTLLQAYRTSESIANILTVSCQTAFTIGPDVSPSLSPALAHGRRHLSIISAHLQKTTKTASASSFISWPIVL